MLDDDEEGVGFDLEESGSNPAEEYVDIPEVDPPTVRNPADDLPDPSEVDTEVLTAFWAAVLYANVALFGVSLGLMLIGFRGQWRWGGAAILVGVLAGIRVYQTHRAFKQRDGGDTDEPDGATGENPPGTDETADTRSE